MGVTAAGNTSTVSAALFKPRASLVVVNPVTRATIAVPVLAVAYVDLAVGASLDTTGRYKFITDAAAVVDSARLTPGKGLFDSVGTQSYERYELAKELNDTVLTLDTLTQAVGKRLADTYGVADAAVHELTKRVFDAAGVTEDSVYELSKRIADGVAMNDLADVGDGSVYSFVKGVTNVVFANEQLARGVSKRLEDSVAALSLPMLLVEKAPFTDAVDSADSSTRAAELGKSDQVGASDTQVLDVTKLVTDAFAVAEFIQAAVDKALADSVAAPDQHAFTLGKPALDTVGASSAAAYDLSKLFGDSVGTTDSVEVVIVLIRDFLDSFGVTDSRSFAFTKATQDGVVATEALSRDITKALADGVGMSDFAGVGDGIAFVLVRTVANVAFIADNSARESLLAKSELTNVTDSGSIVNQDYCDLTYFAEDYVGVARSF